MLSRRVSMAAAVLASAFVTVPVAASQTNLLNISPGVISIPAALGSTAANSEILIRNTGPGSATITGFSITGAQASDFSVSAGTCPLSPDSLYYECSPSVTFTPPALGLRQAKLVVTDVGMCGGGL